MKNVKKNAAKASANEKKVGFPWGDLLMEIPKVTIIT